VERDGVDGAFQNIVLFEFGKVVFVEDKYGGSTFDNFVSGEGFDGEAEVVEVTFVVRDEGGDGVSFFGGMRLVCVEASADSCGGRGVFVVCDEEKKEEGGWDNEKDRPWEVS